MSRIYVSALEQIEKDIQLLTKKEKEIELAQSEVAALRQKLGAIATAVGGASAPIQQVSFDAATPRTRAAQIRAAVWSLVPGKEFEPKEITKFFKNLNIQSVRAEVNRMAKDPRSGIRQGKWGRYLLVSPPAKPY